ncbi:hypothetical protein CAEBREN_11079 [Caenorhabditis brenneri]|uniref:C-type lectin domain-containing protein n=1 Tax=Caenorhabditis brenneri TaxID=135651 RepID=G0N7A0_CAEBE|nr:hypothetical protein CAEBREN_11079 [Caenorhabditis brenneri]
MSRLILLFLSIPFVLSAAPKCPEGFGRVRKEPTAKNNHTIDWCFAVFPHEKAASRDYARGLCANYNSTLSIPQNLEEFHNISKVWSVSKDAFERDLNKNFSNILIAVDGEFTPKCKATMVGDRNFNPEKDKGECGLHQDLFSFDSSKTDPTFALNHNIDGYPNGKVQHTTGDVSITMYASCLAMDPDTYTKNHTLDPGHLHLNWCDGRDGELENMYAVLCGRPPQ